MTIYISTGGFKSEPASKSVIKLINYGAKNIELSGGTYSPTNIKKLSFLNGQALHAKSLGFIHPLKNKWVN